MPIMFELTELNTSTFHTGTIYSPAGSQAASLAETATGFHAGSWHGLANTWGVDTVVADSLVSASAGVISMGAWHGIAYSYGIETVVTESSDRFSVTSEQNPSPNQGITLGEWDHFPIPPPPPKPQLPERDQTRYRKTYSGHRVQPRRIRYIKG